MTVLRGVKTLTFDCYGTLVDWESGILHALRSAGFAHPGTNGAGDDALLSAYAELELRNESGEYRPYREVLARTLEGLAQQFRLETPPARDLLAKSLPNWPAFADTAEALRALHTRFQLGVISNIDEDLFEQTRLRCGLTLDWVVTAERCRSYKPSHNNFKTAMRIHHLEPGEVLHVASSVGHDIAPASELGIRTVWLNRRHGKAGRGANGPGEATPTYTVSDCRGLLRLLNVVA